MIHKLQNDKAELTRRLEFLQEQNIQFPDYKNFNSVELKKLIENSFNEYKYFGKKEPFSPEESSSKLKKMLRDLTFNDRFLSFLKINDLDPTKFFSGVLQDTKTSLEQRLQPSSTTHTLNRLSISVDDNISQRRSSCSLKSSASLGDLNLSMAEYFEFSYILARRLEKEEYERLKTEEQYQMILQKQIEQSQAIERREKEMRNKLKSMVSAFDENS